VWCPSGGKDTSVPGSDEAIYTNAKDLFETEFYAQSKDSFQLLINQYPESHYSHASMKDLFALEKFVSNNYDSLMQYYRTNDSIQADSSLAKLGYFLANKCDVKLENWQTAIYWYEDVIQNPESTEDSIFAIIDLGYTYFLMNNSGNKAGYTGKMLEHIPKSMKEFREKRDYLLSLLPVDKKNQALENSLKTLKAGELSQNIPNPFSNTTTIYYKLFESGLIHIKVFNHIGIEVKAINEAVKEKGLHIIDLNVNDLPAGIYYYSLLINGKLSDTKKMVVVK
jgi:tetratricopeptide (TPR) repeat protein